MNIRTLKNSLLKTLAGLFIVIPLALSPITANAVDDGTIDTDAIKNSVKKELGFNGVGEDTNKDYGQRNKGVTYTRTGYLCYIVDKSGNNVSEKAVALSSPGFYAIEGSEWIVKSRTGLTVGDWSGTAPWNVTPWQESGSSNVSEIRSYLMTDMGDGTIQAQDFIKRTWGTDISNQFSINEAFLVIETIMNFQFSTVIETSPSTVDYGTVYLKTVSAAQSQIATWSDGTVYTQLLKIQNKKVTQANFKELMNSVSRNDANKTVSLNYIKSDDGKALLASIEEELSEKAATTSKYYKYYGSPYIGTVPNMLDAKDSLGIKNDFGSFTNETAPQAEKIQEDQCGFKACSASGRLSDSDVRNYGVAMVIISANKSDQTTCDEKVVKSTPVHPAANESTGTMTIVKNYRSLNADGTYKEEGCKITTNVAGKITIEDESKYASYKVKAWKITNDPAPAADIDSTKWESEMTSTAKVGSIQQEGTNTGSVNLNSPSTTLYLLLEKTGDIQTTYDESQGDTPASPAKESEGTMQIVKSYRINKGGSYTDKGTFNITNIAESIVIEDEQSYKVAGWKISTSSATSVSSTSWETAVPSTILKQGTAPTTVTLDPTKGAKTLYVLLEKQEAESEDYNYKLTQSQITRRVWFSTPDNKLTNMTEQILEHDFQFTKPSTDPVSCNGHKYYVQCITHHETHMIKEGYYETDPKTKKQTWVDPEYCYGCTDSPWYEDNGMHCPYDSCQRTDYCLDWQWSDSSMNMSLDATLTNADTAVVWSSVSDTYKAHTVKNKETVKMWYSMNNTDVSWTDKTIRKYLSEYTDWVNKNTTTNKNWNYIALLVRGKDIVTISDWKNDSTTKNILTEMLSSKGFQIANKPVTSRYTSNAGSNTFYKDQFTAEFNKDSKGDYDTRWAPTKEMSMSAYKVSEAICNPGSVSAYLASPMTINDITLKVEVYVGQPSLTVNTDIDTSLKTYPSGSLQNGKASGRMVKSGGTITFYPYIEMKYDAFSVTNQPVYVMGIYERQITPNDYAELDWDSDGSRITNLTLNSTQWSTHSQSQSHPAGTVLPGGATLNLTISESNRRKITARTYQTIIMDSGSGREQINNTGSDGGLTESAAKSAHTNYVNSVTDAIQQLMVNQYVSPYDNATYDNIFQSKYKVTNGTSLKFLNNNSSNASEESKYYFKEKSKATSGYSDSGMLDTKVSSTNTTYYTFRTDTYGNVYMRTSNSSGDTGSEVQILSQGEDENSLSGIARELNNKTYVVKKLLASIERSGGNDSTALTGTQWYNEAIDGITVLVQSTTIEIGFITPSERHTVLDPKLIPYNKDNNKSSLATKYFSSAYKTDNYSHKYNEVDVLGEFKSTRISLSNLENMFTSSIFYIPNLTTQDLR